MNLLQQFLFVVCDVFSSDLHKISDQLSTVGTLKSAVFFLVGLNIT